ncbi:MAG: T9SS type A sorting domain-containing protein [Bacteroidota bacterium]
MKKLPLLTLSLLACVFTLNAQEISFTFTANHTCEYAPLDSVLVENLTQGGDTTLYWNDTVLTFVLTGVEMPAAMENDFHVSQNYPNPFSSKTKIDVFVPEQDDFTINVYDVTGRRVTTYENSLEKGMHNFTFNAGNSSNYILTVNSTKYVQKILMIRVGTGDNPSANLTYNGIMPGKKSMLKSGRSYFPYEIGDELEFTGYVDGDFEEIIDTPSSDDNYMFDINCPFSVCGEDEIVDVTNPTTGYTWMDRNLGASQQATAFDDHHAYGALFQWGRLSDGHECITWTSSSSGNPNNGTTSTTSSSDEPSHSDFILIDVSPHDWRDPQNDDLWQGVSGTNNPCPSGYRLPTESELQNEMDSWDSGNAAGAYASPLKLPVAGYRTRSYGSLSGNGSDGTYWSSTVDGVYARRLYFGNSDTNMGTSHRAYGLPLRCIKD